MNHLPALRLLGASALAAALVACGSVAPAETGGGRPALPTGISVSHPAAAANTYLLLLTESGQTVYQQAVIAGSTVTQVTQTPWTKETAKAQPLAQQVPAGATYLEDTQSGTPVLFYHWALWQDVNANGIQEAGERTELMTHDRVAYAEKAVHLRYTTQQPNMIQEWKLRPGWSRAEHYVYLPTGSATYRRLFESAPVQHFTLHVPTPLTSQ